MRRWWIAFCLIGSTLVGGTTLLAAPSQSEKALANTFSPALLRHLELCLQQVENRYRDDPQFQFQLQAHCPNLAHSLSRGDLSAWVQPALEAEPSLEQLMDLRSIAATIFKQPEANTSGEKNGFAFAALPHILEDTLVLEPQEDKSWWKRFLHWLAEVFERGESRQPGWLKSWLSNLSIPEWVVEAFYTGVVILLAIMLLAIVIVEVRAAGIRHWFKRRTQQLGLSKPRTSEEYGAELTWDAISQLPSGDKILAAYNKLLHILAGKQFIPADSSLTNHELQSHLEHALGAEQPTFRQLVRGVENILYGGKAMDRETEDGIVRASVQFASHLPAQPTR